MCVFLCSCHLIIHVGSELNKCLCFSLTDLHTKSIFIFLIHWAHPDRHSFQFVLSWLNGYNNHHVLSTYSDNYNWFLNTVYPLHDNVLTFIRCFNLGPVGQHQCMEKVSRPLLPIRTLWWSHLDDPPCVTFQITYVNEQPYLGVFVCWWQRHDV